MTYSEAALCYNIPKTTIFCRLKGINEAAGVGRPRAISQVTERLIVELVQFMSEKLGFKVVLLMFIILPANQVGWKAKIS